MITSKVVNDGAGLGTKTHLAGIVTVSLEVSPELSILLSHPICRQRLDEKEGNQSRKNRQTASDPERTSVSTNGRLTTESLDDRWESPSANKGSDLSNSSSDTLVLTTHGGRTGLGCQETKVVSWSDFSKREENSVYDGEGADVFSQFGVETAHDKSDDCLAKQADDHGIFWSEGINNEGADKSSGEVESIDDDTPSKNNRKRVVSTGYIVHDGGRVQAEGVDDEVIDEPRGGDSEETTPITLDDQPIRDLGIPHRIALESLRFLHVQSPKQDSKSGDDTETKGETPDGPEMVGSEDPVEHQRHERGDHETHVNHTIGCEGEPTVLRAL